MLKKIILAFVLGAAGGGIITSWILNTDLVQAGLLSLSNLGVIGGALVSGVLAASFAPKLFEVIVAACSVGIGTLGGLAAFGRRLIESIQSAGEGSTSLLTDIVALVVAFALSGGLIIVSAAIGGAIVARIRRRTERAYGSGPGAYYG